MVAERVNGGEDHPWMVVKRVIAGEDHPWMVLERVIAGEDHPWMVLERVDVGELLAFGGGTTPHPAFGHLLPASRAEGRR
jgi:hypothetical protein